MNRKSGKPKRTYDEKLLFVNEALEIENARLVERLSLEQQRVFVLQAQIQLMEARVKKLLGSDRD